jgi:ribosomal protein S18 acetylase RimI-like enzyme
VERGEVADELRIRHGGEADVATVLALLDAATRWLVARGRVGQWGTEPHSTNPRRIEMVTGFARTGGLYLAYLGDEPVGTIAVGAAPPHVPPAAEPELYVNLLVTSRAHRGQRIGRHLLDHARRIARQRDVDLLRVDCYGGDDRALVRYYEGEGFTATDTFTVELATGKWPGQVLEQRMT